MHIKRPASTQPIPNNAKKVVDLQEFIDIAISTDFIEKEIVPKLYEAMLYPEKKEELRKLFSPRTM